MGTEVRPGEPLDLDWLIEELRDFASFYGTKFNLFGSPDHARSVMAAMIKDHLVLIAEREDGQRMGFIAGQLALHPFNPEIRVLSETFWWVAPAFRGSRAGLALLNEFVEWGKVHVDWVICSLEHKSPVSDRVLLKRGFVPQERQYLLEVSHG